MVAKVVVTEQRRKGLRVETEEKPPVVVEGKTQWFTLGHGGVVYVRDNTADTRVELNQEFTNWDYGSGLKFRSTLTETKQNETLSRGSLLWNGWKRTIRVERG